MEIWQLQEKVDAIDEYEINSLAFSDIYKCFSVNSAMKLKKAKLMFLGEALKQTRVDIGYGYEVAQFFVDWLDDPEDEEVITQKEVFELLTKDGLDDTQRVNAKLLFCSMTMLMSSVSFINVLTSSDFWGLVSHASIQNDREFALLYCAEMLSQARKETRPISELRPNVSNIIKHFDTNKPSVERSLMELHERLSEIVSTFNEFMVPRLLDDVEFCYLMVATAGRLAAVMKRESLDDLWDKFDSRRGEYLGEIMSTCLKKLKASNLPHPLFKTNLEEYFNTIREKVKLEGGVASGDTAKNKGRI